MRQKPTWFSTFDATFDIVALLRPAVAVDVDVDGIGCAGGDPEASSGNDADSGMTPILLLRSGEAAIKRTVLYSVALVDIWYSEG